MSSEITNQINTTTNTFNDQISALESIIPSPINATDVIYKDNKTVDDFLKDIVTDIEATGYHVSKVLSNIRTLSINNTDVNYDNDKAIVKQYKYVS
jgi:hypothetical protein